VVHVSVSSSFSFRHTRTDTVGNIYRYAQDLIDSFQFN
jgi:hypothetical protein